MSWLEKIQSVASSSFSNSTKALTTVGFLAVLYTSTRLSLSIWNNFRVFFLARHFPRYFALDLSKFGSWAVVTGATDGIGKQYAIQLAKIHRLNIVLISRSIDKLNDVAREIESSCPGVQTKCIVADFTGGPEIYDNIESGLADLDVAILVNNVGYPGRHENETYFCNTGRTNDTWDVIHVNCCALTVMTQLVLPGMIKKNKGAIVNVSSGAAIYGMPSRCIYAGTKGYVGIFTRSLQMECHGTGLVIQVLYTGNVSTKLVGYVPPSMFVLTPENYVRSAIAAIGFQPVTAGCLEHEFLIFLISFFPEFVRRRLLLSSSRRSIAYARKLQERINHDKQQ